MHDAIPFRERKGTRGYCWLFRSTTVLFSQLSSIRRSSAVLLSTQASLNFSFLHSCSQGRELLGSADQNRNDRVGWGFTAPVRPTQTRRPEHVILTCRLNEIKKLIPSVSVVADFHQLLHTSQTFEEHSHLAPHGLLKGFLVPAQQLYQQ